MQDKIKSIREEVDCVAQAVDNLKPVNGKNTKEITSSVKELYMAKAWLGKTLEELGVENPYKQDAKTKEEITETQDVSKFEIKYKEGDIHLDKVNYLRTCIGGIVKIVKDLDQVKDFKPTREFSIARTNCYTRLCQARFHLGFELARIKNS